MPSPWLSVLKSRKEGCYGFKYGWIFRECRSGSRGSARSEMVLFVTIFHDEKSLIIAMQVFILDVAGILDPPP